MISIIVPVYNVEKYISRCIQSIIAQTYTDWELVLINDGSKDNSGKICDEFASKDDRIKVYHKKNGGVSSARNKGLELAGGEYICFIDSDDWVDKSYLSDFKINSTESDLYISGALYDINDEVYSYKKYLEKECTTIGDIKKEYFLQDLFSNGYPWGKLFKKEIISKNNLQFNEDLPIHEDHLFVFQYLSQIGTLFVTNSAGYHYLVVDNTGRKLSGRLNTYIQLKTASSLFNDAIYVLKDRWLLNEDEYAKLTSSFVYSIRLNALRSLVLEGNKTSLKNEVAYWRNVPYMGGSKKERIILTILRANLFFKFNLLVSFFKFIQYMHKDQLEMIYKDLQSRSTVLKQ